MLLCCFVASLLLLPLFSHGGDERPRVLLALESRLRHQFVPDAPIGSLRCGSEVLLTFEVPNPFHQSSFQNVCERSETVLTRSRSGHTSVIQSEKPTTKIDSWKIWLMADPRLRRSWRLLRLIGRGVTSKEPFHDFSRNESDFHSVSPEIDNWIIGSTQSK